MARKQLGAVASNTTDAITKGGAETLTGKTLTNPQISNILDINNSTMIGFSPSASSVNYFQMQNGATGSAVWLYAVGVDSNVTLVLAPQAAGSITGWANSQVDMKLLAAGSNSDVGWNFTTQGAGVVRTPALFAQPLAMNSATLPANYCTYFPDLMEVSSGQAVEIGSGAVMEIG